MTGVCGGMAWAGMCGCLNGKVCFALDARVRGE